MSHLILQVANAVDLWERRRIKMNLKDTFNEKSILAVGFVHS